MEFASVRNSLYLRLPREFSVDSTLLPLHYTLGHIVLLLGWAPHLAVICFMLNVSLSSVDTKLCRAEKHREEEILHSSSCKKLSLLKTSINVAFDVTEGEWTPGEWNNSLPNSYFSSFQAGVQRKGSNMSPLEDEYISLSKHLTRSSSTHSPLHVQDI